MRAVSGAGRQTCDVQHHTCDVETRYIIDGLGYDMRCPDVVLAASDRYGYVTAYTIYAHADYDIVGSITFNIDDLVAVQFKVFEDNKKDSRPWYKRLFS